MYFSSPPPQYTTPPVYLPMVCCFILSFLTAFWGLNESRNKNILETLFNFIFCFLNNYKYMVRQCNFWNGHSMSLGCWVRQTHVSKHIWTCSNLPLHELQNKWVFCSQAAEEVIYVYGILLVEEWVTRNWSSGQTSSFVWLVKC
jgi:hypothetical protein